jgi:hypothetical protein
MVSVFWQDSPTHPQSGVETTQPFLVSADHLHPHEKSRPHGEFEAWLKIVGSWMPNREMTVVSDGEGIHQKRKGIMEKD